MKSERTILETRNGKIGGRTPPPPTSFDFRFSIFALLVALALTLPAGATTVTGTIQKPDGTPVTGIIEFVLSQQAKTFTPPILFAPVRTTCAVTSGQIAAGCTVQGNDTLDPAGTYYTVRVVDTNNRAVVPAATYTIAGSSVDLGTLPLTATATLVPPSGAVTGNLSVSGNLTVAGSADISSQELDVSHLRLLGLTADPATATDGSVFHRSDLNRIRFHAQGLQLFDGTQYVDITSSSPNTVDIGGDLRVAGATQLGLSADLSCLTNPPASPSAGNTRFYCLQSDKRIYEKDDAGLEAGPLAALNQPQSWSAAQTFPEVNNLVLADALPGATAGEKIANCIAALPATGGTCDARGLEGPQSIAADFFSGVTKPGKLLLGAATFTVFVSLRIPDNWELAGAGAQTVLMAAGGTNLTSPTCSVLTNSKNTTYLAASGHSTGIVIHDLVIDGNKDNNVASACQQGIGLRGADNSAVYNVTVQNINLNGIDIRDGDNNIVRDNFCDTCAAQATYHAIGGGVVRSDGLFRRNKFVANHARGTGASSNDFDINGQGSSAVCEQNEFIGNTSDAPGRQAFYSDTCAKGVWANNISVNAGAEAFAFTSGVGTQGAVKNSLSGNIVLSPASQCFFFGNIADFNSLSASNICELPQQECVKIADANQNLVSLQCRGPSQGSAGAYSGVLITTGGASNATANNVAGATIWDVGSKMKYGVELSAGGGGGVPFVNLVRANAIFGGAAGNTNHGVQDGGTSTFEWGNTWDGEGALTFQVTGPTKFTSRADASYSAIQLQAGSAANQNRLIEWFDRTGTRQWALYAAGDGSLRIFDQARGADAAIFAPNGSLTLAPAVAVAAGLVPDATGLKHKRVSISSIVAGASASVTLTWTTPFADPNYTVVGCEVEDTTAATLALRKHHIESKTAAAVTVRIVNDDDVAAHSGTLHCTAVHD